MNLTSLWRFLFPVNLALLSIFLTGCSSSSYVMRSDHSEIFSPSMGKPMAYSVYTPPNWSPEESLPLMVLLHGARDNQASFDKFAVGEILDEEILAGNAPRVVIVSPNGELGFWENWHDGSKLYRDWVVKDLMPHAARRYSTLPCPQHCYVTGISMGGHGALRFAYYEPNQFNSVAALSAPIISKLHPGEPSIGQSIIQWLIPSERIWGVIDDPSSDLPKDLDPYVSWVERDDLHSLPLLLVWGNDDGKSIISANQHFSTFLSDNNKAHESMVYDGDHAWVHWRRVMKDVLRFHSEQR